MTHQAGHGNVTLPADYVRDHVRLGYAATEHGWQSDTVDTAIALTSPATTRRGLYVAATRGRDANTLCVVTDSDDIAEARDVLEAVLAADRADVPATTQRRNLAQTAPPTDADTDQAVRGAGVVPDRPRRRPTRPSPPPKSRQPSPRIRRADATAAVAAADATLADVAAATADDRDALRAAEARAVDARRATPARNVASRPRRAGSDAPPATTSTSPNINSNEPRTTSPAPVNEPAPPSNATTGPSPPSATPTKSSEPATRSTASTP